MGSSQGDDIEQMSVYATAVLYRHCSGICTEATAKTNGNASREKRWHQRLNEYETITSWLWGCWLSKHHSSDSGGQLRRHRQTGALDEWATAWILFEYIKMCKSNNDGPSTWSVMVVLSKGSFPPCCLCVCVHARIFVFAILFLLLLQNLYYDSQCILIFIVFSINKHN